jgi:NADH-quinone oxidoreductase subunit N
MSANLDAILPAIIIMFTGFIVLLGDSCVAAWRSNSKGLNAGVSLVGILIALFFTGMRLGKPALNAFGGAIVDDPFARCANLMLLVTAGLAVLLSHTYLENKKLHLGEYYVLILFSLFGAMLMVASNDLITLFVAVETLSVALYVLAGFARTEERSEEAALKYFLLGAFAAGFLLYGVALIYGGTGALTGNGGTTNLTAINAALTGLSSAVPPIMFIIGVALVFVGLGFKAALVPFHMWAPDVYQGAPTSVTAYMAAGVKIAIFAVIFRFCNALAPISDYWLIAVQVLAVLTMFGGNILALTQENVKRMLSYSSVAHAGYLMAAVAALAGKGSSAALEALNFYLFSYALVTMGSFGVLIWLSKRGRDCQNLADLKGLVRIDPPAAYMMLIFMLSLGGIPPTMGFLGKWMIFNAILQSGQLWLAIALGIASIISIYYYLKVVWMMCFSEPDKNTITDHATNGGGVQLVMAVSVIGSLLFGLVPGLVQNLFSSAIQLIVR